MRQVIALGLEARQLDERRHCVVLLPVPGCVAEGGGFCEIAKHRHLALEDHQRLARQRQRRKRLPYLVKNGVRLDGDLPARDVGVAAADQLARGPLAASRQHLFHREHVHLGADRIERRDRPRPDLRLERRRCQVPLHLGHGKRGVVFAPEGDEIRVSLERFVQRRIQRQRLDVRLLRGRRDRQRRDDERQ